MRNYIGLSIVLITSALATSPSFAEEPSFYSYGNITSGYTFPDLRYDVSKNWVYQVGTTATWKNGFFADVWLSQDLEDRSFAKGRASEFDVTGGWSGTCAGMTCTLQASYFAEPTVGSFKDDIVKLRAIVSKDYPVANGTIGWFAGADYFALLNSRDTQALRVGVTASQKISGSWALSGKAGYAYNTLPHYADGTYEVELMHASKNGWSFGPYAEGYVPLNRGNQNLVVYGLKFGKAW